MPLLQEKLAAVLGGAGECVFVKLDKHLPVVSRQVVFAELCP